MIAHGVKYSFYTAKFPSIKRLKPSYKMLQLSEKRRTKVSIVHCHYLLNNPFNELKKLLLKNLGFIFFLPFLENCLQTSPLPSISPHREFNLLFVPTYLRHIFCTNLPQTSFFSLSWSHHTPAFHSAVLASGRKFSVSPAVQVHSLHFCHLELAFQPPSP